MITDFAEHLSKYLGIYLPGQAGVSINTIRSYRDTFSLFLRYCQNERNQALEKLTLKHIDCNLIEQFLCWLENERSCCTSTRNNRLAAIQAFYRYLQIETPHLIAQCQQILAIPYKKTHKKVMSYLTLDEIQILLTQPDTSTTHGRRDLTLLSLLYDTGARVQELVDLKIEDIRLSEPTVIRLTGKGNKSRLVPIMSPTEKLLRQYLAERDSKYTECGEQPLFVNRSGKKFTRAGIAYILNKYIAKANTGFSSKKISPHCLRHSKAMHLLQSGVNLVYIRDLLGHTDVSTTEIYARADEKLKRKALEEAYPSPTPISEIASWQMDYDLLSWLKDLGK